MATLDNEQTGKSNHFDETPIQQFYNNKSLFLTGGTGFFGKIILEKLLRTTRIKKIYLLVRMKKGKDVQERLNEIFNDPIFDQMKTLKIDYRERIHVINGDCGLENCGISNNDRIILINNVNIIIHGAATVRFDEKLKYAITVNVNGTKEILKLCHELKNLLSIVHLSSAFANCIHKYIEEKFYENHLNGNNAIKLSDCLDDITLNQITKDILKDFPNTYAFTKAIAENVVLDDDKKSIINNQRLPITIFRPSIVLTTYMEPIRGWTDNMYGPIGIVLGVYSGVIRCFYANSEYNAHIVPVDMSVNALLASAWDIANNQYKEIPIYNYVPDNCNPIRWRDFLQIGYEFGIRSPLMECVWYPVINITKYQYIYKIMEFFYHTIPGYLMDGGLYLIGKEPRMRNIYKKVHKYGAVMSYFSNGQWRFTNDNIMKLWTKLSENDQKIYFFDMRQIDWRQYLQSSVLGVRKFLVKDDPSTINLAKQKVQRLKIVHYSIVYLIYLLIGFLIYILVMKLFSM